MLLGRFVSVGAGATAVHYLVLTLLVEGFAVGAAVAAATGASCGALAAYLGHRRKTFRHRGPVFRSLPRFFAVSLLCVLGNAVLVLLLGDLAGLDYRLAQARRDRRTAVGDLSPSSTLDLLMMIEPSLASKLEAPCLLSVVVPVFNEEAVLPAFHQRLGAVLGDLGDDCEVLYVDDGSTDRSATILAQLQAADRRVGVARFTRNFGKEQAMSAGLKLSRGAAVIVIDADLQDPRN